MYFHDPNGHILANCSPWGNTASGVAGISINKEFSA
jgi:hypothetical protein